MSEYHKIQTVWHRDPETNHKTLIEGAWARPEFELLKDIDWLWEEKVDGMNTRVIYDGFGVEFRGRTDRAQMPPKLAGAIEQMFPIEKLERVFGGAGDTVVLYGEGYGAGIQKGGGNYRPDQSFILFDVRVGDVWLAREAVAEIANALDIFCAPTVCIGTLSDAIERVRSGNPSLLMADGPAEGLIMRPKVELCDRMGRRIIAKIKARDFR